MNRNLIAFAVLICFGCSNTPKKNATSSDTVKIKHKSIIVVQTQPSLKTDREKIMGIWTNSSTQNAVFDIRKDSIYYVEKFESYKYVLKQDSIQIYYPDFVYTAKLYFIKDTLTMDSKDDGIAKFWKFKN